MTDLVALHDRAAAWFGQQVDAVGSGDWGRPTPCSEWDVRALVNHLVYEDLWVPEILAGKTVEEVGDRFDGDVVGDDPVGAWRTSAAAASSAIRAPGALDRTVHLSFGDVPGSEYVGQLTADLTIHGWDLAKALGRDDAIDASLLDAVWEMSAPQEEMLRGSGMFGSHVDVADDADLQTKLLALVGRRRDWSA